MTATTSEPKATFKRDFLKNIEAKVQAKWASQRAFESDAPEDIAEASKKEKFMVTFPYPYMNGKLHLGHGFSASKAEFAAGYERMRGKKVLFPFAFHCTGMPIKASADKLKAEMEKYGCPPVVPTETDSNGTDTNPTASKHSKVAAKTGTAKLQWDIMRQLGIADEEIAKFVDPFYWMEFFPPLARADLTALGCHIDWRRSFITTDKNPFYDAFIRWQFNKLKAQDKIKFGKRHTIFSPLDGQPCLDHDRASGEGVEPKEFTVVKLKVVEFPVNRETFSALKGVSVFLCAATLRPETMYGQTNCWVGPEIEYGAYRGKASNEVFICTKRAASNMAYQEITCEDGKLDCLATFKGMDLMGTSLSAPLSLNKIIYVLPMFSVSADIGTGVVTSVPSNSPADYVALRELREKEPLRRKFDIKDEMVFPFEPIPIIKSVEYGDLSAEVVVKKLGIKSQNDAVALEKAKEMVYKEDFYSGTMLVGSHSGESVQSAKMTIRDELIRQGDAFLYYEPESKVISRSGDECVVALTDQWYIDYGEPSWRAQAEKCLERMECYSDEVKHQFKSTLDWMRQWACSRSFGLGSKLPWDPTYLIESLSDSTIYMAFYCVAHILHQGSYDGSVCPNGIKPDQMTDEVWEWIYGVDERNSIEMEGISGIKANLLDAMRREFRYWYPMDLRVSGKDLVPNHLTFSIYNHVAIFPEEFWPRGMRANGHLLLNSEKMSKSTGNFMTIRDAIETFGADATRLALADAGDSIEDANFLVDTANMAILRLYTLIEFCQEFIAGKEATRDDSNEEVFADRVFAAEINQAIKQTQNAYNCTQYRDALKFGFFELQNARDRYRDSTVVHGSLGMKQSLIRRFIETQALLIAPICPHFAEHIWCEILKNSGGIQNVAFPAFEEVDASLLTASSYLHGVAHDLRIALQAEVRPKKGPAKTVDSADIFVATAYPKWQEDAVAVLKTCYDGIRFCPDDEIVKKLQPLIQAKAHKKLVPFVMELKNRVLIEGASALERRLAIDELQILSENIDYLTRSLGLLALNIKAINPSACDGEENVEIRRRQEASLPGEPSAYFHSKASNTDN